MPSKSDLEKLFQRGQKRVRQVRPKTNSWASNVIKSLGLAALDVIDDVAPNTAHIATSAVEAGSALKEELVKSRAQSKRLGTVFDNNVYVGIGKEWFKNALADIKSGKLYNKERVDKLIEDVYDEMDFGLGDEDFDSGSNDDFDFSFDDTIESDDGGASASFSSRGKNGNSATQITLVNNIGPDSPLVQATENQTEIVVKAAELQTKTSNANAQLIIRELTKSNNNIISMLGTMNQTISDIHADVTSTLSHHAALASQYFSDSISLQTEMRDSLKKLESTMTAQAAASTASTLRENRKAIDLLDMFSGGTVDIKEYINYIKRNVKVEAESNIFTSSIMGVMSDKDTLRSIAASPLQAIPRAVIKTLVPAMTQATMNALDKSLGEFLVTGLSKIGSWRDTSENPVLQMLGRILGIKNEARRNVDKTNYERGPVPWDGVARRALVDIIPQYLSQIAAAVTGTQQMVFDYNSGTFKSIKSIQKESENDYKNAILGEFSSDRSDYAEFIKKTVTAANKDTLDNLTKTFDDFLMKMTAQGGINNFSPETIANVLGISDPNDVSVRTIRGMIEGRHRAGMNAANMAMAGRKIQSARANVSRRTAAAEADPTKYNVNYIGSGLEDIYNSGLTFRKNGTIELKDTGGPLADKFGKKPVEYLRNILNTLNRGILVEVTNWGDQQRGGGRHRRGGRGGGGGGESDIRRQSREALEKYKSRDDEINRRRRRQDQKEREVNSQYNNELLEGKFDAEDETVSTAAYEAAGASYFSDKQRQEDEAEFKINENTPLAKFARALPPGMRGAVLSVDAFFQRGANKLNRGIRKIDNYLYTVLFGENENGQSVIQGMLDRTKEMFRRVGSWIKTRVFEPLDKALFGEDGLFTKIKQSAFGQDVSRIIGNIKDTIIGTKVTDAEGHVKYEGGLLSATANEFKNIGTAAKNAIFGERDSDGKLVDPENDHSVFGELKRMGRNVGDYIADSLGMRRSDDSGNIMPLGKRVASAFDDVWGDVKAKFSAWTDAILGPDIDIDNPEVTARSFISSVGYDLKGQKGAIGAGASLGVLGSFFLPGGPVGGALIGAASAMVKKSETLQTVLFGPTDDETGERTGGIITKEMSDFFSKNKKFMGAGAIAGLASQIGLIPSMLVPGGPIGGALIGTAVGMAAKSDAIQTFLFGEQEVDADGNVSRKGGVFKKITDKLGGIKFDKNTKLNAGIGAGVGLIGSFFLPGGPILGSLLGAASGIAASTEKFKKFMFGEEEFDEEGKSLGRKGGLFGKVTTFVEDSIFRPLKKTAQAAQIKLIGFVEQNMVAPLIEAFAPITNKFKEVGNSISSGFKSMFHRIADRFHESVTKPFADAAKPFVDKFKQALNKVFGGIFKVIGTVLSAPFKVIGAIGRGIFEGDKKRGEKAAVNEKLDEAFDFSGRRERGEKIGVGGFLGLMKDAFSEENRARGRYSDKGAAYAESDTSLKNPEVAKADYIAKSKARTAARLAALNSGAGEAKRQRGIRSWLWWHRADQITSPDIPTNESGKEEEPSKAADEAEKATQTNEEIRDGQTEIKENLKTQIDIENEHHAEKIGLLTTISERLGSFLDAIQSDAEERKARKEKILAARRKRMLAENGKRAKLSEQSDTSVIDEELADAGDIGQQTANVVESTQRRKGGNRSAISLIQKDVSKISDSVYGQLNGVGDNTWKIYNVLKDAFGVTDDSKVGSSNKKHMGFFGKLRTSLNNPIKFITNIALAPVHALVGTVSALGKGLKAAKDAVIGGVKGVGSALMAAARGLGSIVGTILQLPLKLTEIVLEGVKAILPAIGQTIAGAAKLVFTTLTEGVKIAGSALTAGVKALGGIVQGAAQGLGAIVSGALQGLGSLFHGAGLIGGALFKGISKGIGGLFKLGGKAFNGTFKMLSGAAGSAAGGFFGKIFGKFRKDKTQHVTVDGGTLDEVRHVGVVDKVLEVDTVHLVEIVDSLEQVGDGFVSKFNDIIDNFFNKIDERRNAKNRKEKRRRRRRGLGGAGSSTGMAAGLAAGAAGGDYDDFDLTDALDEIDAREEEDAKDLKEETELADIQASGSAADTRAKWEEEDKYAEEKSWRERFLAKFDFFAKDEKEKNKSFSKMFNLKNGLIALAVAAVTPLIIKMLPAIINGIKKLGEWLGPAIQSIATSLKNFFGDSGGLKGIGENARDEIDQYKQAYTGETTEVKLNDDGTIATDENGNVITEKQSSGGLFGRISNFFARKELSVDSETGKVSQVRRIDADTLHQARLGGRVVRKGLSKINKVGVNLLNKKNAVKYAATATAAGNGVKDTIKGAKAIASGAKKTAGRGSIELVDTAAADNSLIKRFLGFADDALKGLVKRLKDFLASKGIDAASNTMVKQLDDLAGSCLTKLKGSALGQFTGIISSGFAKVAGAAASFLISDVGQATLAFVDTNPAKIFKVNEDDVDGWMWGIAKAVEAFLATSVGVWIDIIATIFNVLFSLDIVSMFCTLAYNIIAGTEKANALKANQDKWREQWEAESEADWNAYVANAEANGEVVMSREEWDAKVRMSFEDWNDKKNRTHLQKAGDFVINGVNNVKTGVSNAVNSVKTGITNTKNKIKTGVSNVVTGAKNSVSNAFGAVRNFFSPNKKKEEDVDYAKIDNDYEKAVKTAIDDAKHGDVVGANKYVNKYVSKNNTDAMSGLRSAALSIATGMQSSLWAIKNTFDKVGDEVKESFSGMDTLDKDVDNMTKTTDVKKMSLKDLFKKVTSKKKGIAGVFSTTLSYLAGGLMAPVAGLGKLFSGLTNFGKKAADEYGNESAAAGGYGGFGDGAVAPTMLHGMPYYSQNDPRIASDIYAESDGTIGTMAARGCGPTAMAMIANSYGKKVTPSDMALLATRGGYSTDVGTTPGFFSSAAQQLGIGSEKMNANSDNLVKAIGLGSPVIIQGQSDDPNSPFTSTGHYVVGTGFTNGQVVINDPRGEEYSRAYPLTSVLSGASNIWSFGNPGDSVSSFEETGGFGGKIRRLSPRRRGGFGPEDTTTTSTTDTSVGTVSSDAVTADKVINICVNEVGYIEKASNSQLESKTANPGKANYTKYGGCVGANGDYWCAAFTSWVMLQACNNNKDKARSVMYGGLSASCEVLRSQYTAAGQYDKNPRLGDMIFFSGSRHSGANHIGYVVGIDDAKVYTIEGNTSGSAGVVDNGGEVAYKSYDKTNAKILGYGHPKYDMQAPTAGGRIGSPGTAVGVSYASIGTEGSSNATGTTTMGTSTGSSSISGISGLFSTLGDNLVNSYMRAFGFNTPTASTAGAYDTSYTSTTGTPTSTTIANVTGNDTTEQIWNYLRGLGYTPEGAAGVMGNMQHESGMIPSTLEKLCINRYKENGQIWDSDTYTQAVDSGKISRAEFVKPMGKKYGYGLTQWTWPSTKEGLYDLAKSSGKSIADTGVQLTYLGQQLNSGEYKALSDELKTVTDVQKASDLFLTKYERPSDQGASVKAKRGEAARGWYEKYKNLSPSNTTTAAAGGFGGGLSIKSGKGKYAKALGSKIGGYGSGVYVANHGHGIASKANHYGGFGVIDEDGARVIELLEAMLVEMQGTNSGIQTLNSNSKNLAPNLVSVQGGNTTNVNTTNNTNSVAEAPADTKTKAYPAAKMLASGKSIMK